MRRIWLVLGWLAAVSVVTFAAWQAVKTADAQVSQEPLTPLAVEPVSPPSPSSPSTAEVLTSTTTADAGTATTLPTGDTSTTTVVGEQWTVLPLNSLGGTVIISYRNGEVRLESATPNPGFAVEVDEDGLDRVEVEFKGLEAEYDIRARWHNGQLETSIEGG